MQRDSMKTIVLANHKIGFSKTTCALNVYLALPIIGSRLLAVDLNRKGNSSAAPGALQDIEDTYLTSYRLMLDKRREVEALINI
jgi:cellulose biosynthesis protein BcsQ